MSLGSVSAPTASTAWHPAVLPSVTRHAQHGQLHSCVRAVGSSVTVSGSSGVWRLGGAMFATMAAAATIGRHHLSSDTAASQPALALTGMGLPRRQTASMPSHAPHTCTLQLVHADSIDGCLGKGSPTPFLSLSTLANSSRFLTAADSSHSLQNARSISWSHMVQSIAHADSCRNVSLTCGILITTAM